MSRTKEKRLIRENLSTAQRELTELKEALRQSYICFNQSSDPDILEACIHEISALSARRSAAWRNLRALDGDKIKWQSQ